MASQLFNRRNFIWLVVGIIVIAYGYQLYTVLQSRSYLIQNVTYDDAYYYFQIARNIAHGFGSTFDRLTPTNGYHPLWMMILVPIYYFFGASPDLPINIALVFGLGFEIAGTYVLFKILSRITDSSVLIWSVLLFWVITPFNYFGTNTGLETPLATFFLLLFLYQLIRIQKDASTRAYIWLSIIAGFMMLSRTDYVFIAAAPFFIWLFKKERPTVARIVAYLLPATIMLLPWIIWNLYTFGTIVQTSGAAFALVQHQLVDYGNPGYNPTLLFIKAAFGKLAEALPVVIDQTGAGLVLLIFAGLVWGYVQGRKKVGTSLPTEKKNIRTVLAAFTFCIGLFFFVHVGIRFAFRDWYFVPLLNIIPVIWFAYGIERALNLTSREDYLCIRTSLVSALGVFVALTFLSFTWVVWRNFRTPRIATDIAFEKAYQWINANIPPGEAVGSLNSGIIGYFSNRRVVNLDGLVNNAAEKAISQKRLYAYATQDIGLRYLVDFNQVIGFKFVESWGVPIRDNITPITVIYDGVAYDPLGMTAYRFTPNSSTTPIQ